MISFNDIATTIRTPGAYTEIDDSKALQGLVQNPHKALIIGQKLSEGTKPTDTLISISSDGLADGYFGPGSILARMCNVFKDNNPNTELWAIAISDNGSGVQASGNINVSTALSANGGSCGGAGTYYLMVNGTNVDVVMTSGWSQEDVQSAIYAKVNSMSTLPVYASYNSMSDAIQLVAYNKGTPGNYINIRDNYYTWQSDPAAFSGDSVTITAMANGASDSDLGDAWAIIENERFNYIIQPYADSSNLTEIEDELEDRIGPTVNQQGHGFTAYRGTNAACTTLGNARNCPYNSIMGAYDSPTAPEEWAAALGAVAAYYLNLDPARPLTGLQLKGILPPPVENRWTRAERDVLLYDGIATWTESGGKVLIERCITTYQTNAQGLSDPTYLDITTLATLGELRDQFNTRMINRFISQRFKLADDTFPVQPGSKVATPKTIRQEIVALFTQLRDKGYIENLEDFVTNLIVERDVTDRNRVNVLLPTDLINQFRILAASLQFIL